jgi:hypothetical protein
VAKIMGVIRKTNTYVDALPKGAETTKQRIATGMVAALIASGLIGSAPPASAGCIYGGFSAKSRCDGPIQTDGTWQRCVDYDAQYNNGNNTYQYWPKHRCFLMGPGQNPPFGVVFNAYPDHIDD